MGDGTGGMVPWRISPPRNGGPWRSSLGRVSASVSAQRRGNRMILLGCVGVSPRAIGIPYGTDTPHGNDSAARSGRYPARPISLLMRSRPCELLQPIET